MKSVQGGGGVNENKRPKGHNSLTCIFANAMQQFSSITTADGIQFDHTIKHSHHFNKLALVDSESPMLYTKIQPQSFLSTGEEDF